MTLLDRLRNRIAVGATSVFKHAPYPLEHTLDHRGDPGLCGPGSVSWRVIGDTAAFVGGIRALLVQSAHPEVAAGVADHSRYREDPLGRLSRTSNYVTATTFGAMPEAEEAVRVVRAMHRRVRGESHRALPYSADDPGLAAWVHNALTDSFLTTHRAFGAELSDEAADRFVVEQAAIGTRLAAEPIPLTAAELSAWVATHPALADSPGRREAVEFLRRPPIRGSLRLGYRVLFRGAVATLPLRLRRILGLRRVPGAWLATRALIGFLRWALGSSPTWNLALVRVGGEVPPGVFRQPLPIDSLDQWGSRRSAQEPGQETPS